MFSYFLAVPFFISFLLADMALEGDSGDIQIEQCFLLSKGPFKKYSHHVIPMHDCIVDEGKTYFHCSTVPHWASALFTYRSKNGERMLSRTDIMQQLVTVRTDTLNDIIAKSVRAGNHGDCNLSKPKRHLPVYQKAALAGLPSTVLVEAPSINNVAGVPMRLLVRAKYHTTAPLYVELTPRNIAYLRAACLEQIKSGDIKRSRQARRDVEGECDADGNDKVVEGECDAEGEDDVSDAFSDAEPFENKTSPGAAHEQHPCKPEIDRDNETESEPPVKRLKFSSGDATKRVQSSLSAFFQPCRS